MKPQQHRKSFAMAALAIGITHMAHSATVWNVNLGDSTVSSTRQITTTDNYIGAAAENTANSTWNTVSVTNNSVKTTGTIALSTSTGATSSVTLNISSGVTNNLNSGSNNLTTGDEIFSTWFKVNNNTDPMTVTFAGLPTLASGESYALVIYSDWFFPTGGNMPITQTVGTGLTGTFNFNRTINTLNDQVGSLAQDSNAANVAATANFARLDGLTPSVGNELAFSMTPLNSAVNGFQIILVPEPSAALLGGLGFLALLRRRR